MSNYYPFLYSKEYRNNYDLISACIDSSLMNNYFLHFAGSWYEGDMWKYKRKKNFFGHDHYLKFNRNKKIKLKGIPVGRIIPQKA